MIDPQLLTIAVFAVALVYASVGHGGASGYLAVMALAGVMPAVASSGALLLNLVVAGLAFAAYRNAGQQPGKLVTPFLIGSVPTALLGSFLKIPLGVYNVLLAVVLLAAAIRMLVIPAMARGRPEAGQPPAGSDDLSGTGMKGQDDVIRYDKSGRHGGASTRSPAAVTPTEPVTLPSVSFRIFIGALIGLVSGIVGVGGGILLSPLLLWRKWAGVRMTASASAVFIVINSAAGISGRVASAKFEPALAFPLFLSAALGGWLGGYAGAKKLPVVSLRRILAGVLIIAAVGKVVR